MRDCSFYTKRVGRSTAVSNGAFTRVHRSSVAVRQMSGGGHEALQLLEPVLHEDHLRRRRIRWRFLAECEQEAPSIRRYVVTSSPRDREIGAFEYRLWRCCQKRRGRHDPDGHECLHTAAAE